MVNPEIIGYIAGFLMAIALSPQIIKAWKTKSTKDISIVWTVIVLIGLILWIVYAILNKIMPLLIFASIELSMTFSLFILKIKYK